MTPAAPLAMDYSSGSFADFIAGSDGDAGTYGVVPAVPEAAVALAIVLNFYNNHTTVDVDNAEDLKG